MLDQHGQLISKWQQGTCTQSVRFLLFSGSSALTRLSAVNTTALYQESEKPFLRHTLNTLDIWQKKESNTYQDTIKC